MVDNFLNITTRQVTCFNLTTMHAVDNDAERKPSDEASHLPILVATRLGGPTEEESRLAERVRDSEYQMGSLDRDVIDLNTEVDKLRARQETDRVALMDACLDVNAQLQLNQTLTCMNVDLRKRLAAMPPHHKLRENNRVLTATIDTLKGEHAASAHVMVEQINDLQNIIKHFRDGASVQHQQMQQERDDQLVEIGRLRGLLSR